MIAGSQSPTPRPAQLRSHPRRTASLTTTAWPQAWLGALAVLTMTMLRLGEHLGPVSLIKPVLLVTAIVLLMHLARSRYDHWQAAFRHPMVKLCLAYGLCVVASVPFSIWRAQSFGTLQVLPWAFSLVLFCAMVPPSRVHVDRLLKVLPGVAALTGILIVRAGLTVENGRITSGGSYDTNDLGAVFAFFCILSLGAIRHGKILSRATSIVVTGLLLWLALKTGSRGALLALAAGFVVFVLGLGISRAVVILVAMFILGPLAWPLAPPDIRQRAVSLTNLDDDYNTTSNSGRLYLWKRGLVFAARRPVLGIGAMAFEAQVGEDFREQGTRGAWHTAHNTYVQILAELGVPGAALLLSMIGLGLRWAASYWGSARRVRRPEYLGAMVSYAVAIFFLSHGYTYALFGVLGIATLLRPSRDPRQDRLPLVPAAVSGRSHRWVPATRPV